MMRALSAPPPPPLVAVHAGSTTTTKTLRSRRFFNRDGRFYDNNDTNTNKDKDNNRRRLRRVKATSNNNNNNNNDDPEETKKPSFGGGTDSNGRMHVPTDAFGGMSPEFKAASALKTLFTMVAVRIVLAQEEGYDNEGGGGTPTSIALGKFLEENPLRDGNEWLQKMLECEQTELRLIALRLIEVRRAYAESQFDFNEVRNTARLEIEKDNDKLMVDYMKQSLSAE
jgi:hypothetical protein|tara:strand:+ start:438 stop:1115 length:678 start_codon:yes stop_codon:yes gene_type:complete